MGVFLGTRFDFPFDVKIDAGNVGGPSAGTMFALGVYDRLTPGALTGGKKIAGTGTIDAAGTVGPIGGIRQKLVGAHDGGAKWFLAPADNCDEVVDHVPDGLKVVRIATFDEAKTSVEAIAADQGDSLPDLHEVAAQPCRVARSAWTRPGAMSSPRATWSSRSWARWRSRQRLWPSRVTATSRRTSWRFGWAASASTADSAWTGRSRSASGGTTIRSTARAAPTTLSGQAIPPSSDSRLEVRGRSSCSMALRAPSARSAPLSWASQVRLARDQVRGGDEGEEARVLVPARGRDVAFGVQGGDGQRVGDRLGRLAHAPIVPHPRTRGARGIPSGLPADTKA